MTMRLYNIFNLMFYPVLFVLLVSCGGSANAETKTIKNNCEAEKSITDNAKDIDLIKSVYDIFVFAIDSYGDEINHPDKYFTPHALKRLQDDYEFDRMDEPCYAFNALRTEAQDSKPDSDEASKIEDVKPDGNRWYIVTYSDMGWPGKTRVKIVNGKIDDYHRIDR